MFLWQRIAQNISAMAMHYALPYFRYNFINL